MPISQFDRTRIVALIRGGHAQTEVAHIAGVTQSAVSKTWKRYDDTNDVADRRRTGRPKLTTQRQDRYIQTTALRRPTSSARDITNGVHLSTQTVRNRLHSAQLWSHKPLRCVPLEHQHRRERKKWEIQNQNA